MDHECSGDKVVVITGATSGIGRATACQMAGPGVRLVLVGRNETRGKEVVRRIHSSSPRCICEFLRADLSNLSEVRELAARIKDRYDQIDVLVNNAGARFRHFEQTANGLERTFATNHLGHFLLTSLLLGHMLDARAARIITVASGAHFGVDGTPSWVLRHTDYDRKVAYGLSKLANIVFAYELARRLSSTSVTSNAVDPGGVATNLGRNNGWTVWLRHLIYYAAKRELITAAQAATHIAYLAFADELTSVTGQYFRDRHLVTSSTVSKDPIVAQGLWSLSLKLTRIDTGVGRAWKYLRPVDSP
jgi:NAD(P)-dependent dehydrogenase (short-subunit alcohol dehydrogenase family)